MKGKIRELTEIEDFKEVYGKVFAGPPYFEKYTDEELEKLFNEYKENGYIYGAYDKGKCVGLSVIERGKKAEHPVEFPNKKAMYLAEVAVLENYRKKGLGTLLMSYVIFDSYKMKIEEAKKGESAEDVILYMRTLEVGSNSDKIFKYLGGKKVEGVHQIVKTTSLEGLPQTRKDVFWVNDLEKETIRKTIGKLLIRKKKQEKREGLNYDKGGRNFKLRGGRNFKKSSQVQYDER